ncbi:MAG: rhomboid family intramembrane serine protease [Candidatus Altiarchaeales archaeon]|nr:rhomboid family intramembrane serine protease [Candidatus Altiarchaeales archaeon]MBD3416544.1 rhomboid family intramembrane serine protease [Candidatus Altiarchaeales archaeon]
MYRMFRSRVLEYIILANAFMFIVRLAAPGFAIDYLALTPAYVLRMPWTLLTNMFIHADLMHIFFNMFFGVWMFGTYLQRIIGEKEFTKVYFAGGVAAAFFYIFMSLAFGIPDPRTAAVGASGAVFAVIGTLVVLKPNMTIYFNFFFPMPLWVFASFYLLYSIFAIPAMGDGGGVAVTAHLGGLIAGFIFGQKYKKGHREPEYTYVRYY